jgi:hypothetical protein
MSILPLLKLSYQAALRPIVDSEWQFGRVLGKLFITSVLQALAMTLYDNCLSQPLDTLFLVVFDQEVAWLSFMAEHEACFRHTA